MAVHGERRVDTDAIYCAVCGIWYTDDGEHGHLQKAQPTNINDTLTERGKTHGSYIVQSAHSQALKSLFRCSMNWQHMAEDQKDALEMIAVKISRILSGSANEVDHWLDIAGYATLVETRLRQNDPSKL